MIEIINIRMVGRNPENPSSRKKGIKLEQRLEIKSDKNILGTLTTVQKDNLIMEVKIEKIGQISNECSQLETVVSEKGLFPKEIYRIRKLTPSECWRLMGYKDDDFNKAEKVNSATQLYKQAGNAIVKQVLMAIFLQMGIQGKKKWNEMSVEERQNLVNSSLDFLKDEN